MGDAQFGRGGAAVLWVRLAARGDMRILYVKPYKRVGLAAWEETFIF